MDLNGDNVKLTWLFEQGFAYDWTLLMKPKLWYAHDNYALASTETYHFVSKEG